MKIFVRFMSTTTMTSLEELRLWAFEVAPPFSFYPPPELTVISRLAQSLYMHVIHGAFSFQGLSGAASFHHLFLFWCLFAVTTYDVTGMSFHRWVFFPMFRGPGWSMRFSWLRSSRLLRRVDKHRLLCFQNFLFWLSMLYAFHATNNSTLWRALAREHW